MSNSNKNAGFGAKGYYIALILCAAAIGITSYLYARDQSQKSDASVAEASVEAQADTPAMATQDSAAKASSATDSTTVPTQASTTAPTTKAALKTASPLEGEEIAPYSVESLSYNATTRDWRTHNGVDIAAEAGTPVLAAADGTVYAAYEDETMGYCVILRHSDGYTTTYSSLSEELSVKAGDTVTLGQTIGTVGDTALLESALGAHLHFAVACNGESVDPAVFLALE